MPCPVLALLVEERLGWWCRATRLPGGWSMWCMRRHGETWACSAWRREGKEWGLIAVYSYLVESVGKMDPDSSWRSNS